VKIGAVKAILYIGMYINFCMYILCVLLDLGENWYKKFGHKWCGAFVGFLKIDGTGKDIIFLWAYMNLQGQRERRTADQRN